MHTYDESRLVVELASLPLAAQSGFAQACAWRALAHTSGTLSISASQMCASALDLAAGSLAAGPEDMAISRLLADFDVHAELDEDGMAATAYVLRHLHTFDPQEAAYAARRSYEARDRTAQQLLRIEEFTKETEAKLLSHPHVQTELGEQARDLGELIAQAVSPMEVVTRAKSGDQSGPPA